MSAPQLWLQNHNRKLTQDAIDEALMEYIAHIEKQRDELLAAMEEAIDAVRVFHGPVDWETYRDHSPEMKRWQAAIASVKEK